MSVPASESEKQTLLQQLERVAERCNVRVSYEAMRASVGFGGLCVVKGERRIIIDRRASVEERLATLAHSLSKLELTTLDLADDVRKTVAYYADAPRHG